MVRYKEIKGGSVLEHIRRYNSRSDCFYTGKYKLVYPRPCGDSCGDFLNVCNYTSRIPENQLAPYRPEEILSYEAVSPSDAYAYGEKALKGNALNAHLVQLMDFVIKGNRAELRYLIDADAENCQTLILPFLYIPFMQFSLDVGIGSTHHQTVALALAKGGALIYEIAESSIFTRI